ncbi:MAG TPA: hypothetical protein VE326_14000 [Candidatus Binatia bacterium]|nr:hypothetical protein [Candidatus Binatia bacterium]
MNGRQGWTIAMAVLALMGVGAAVIIAGDAFRDARWHEETRQASLAPEQAQGSPSDTGVARGGPVPRGQTPAVALTVPRFLDAFNADASDRRVLILLSPT